MRNIPVQLEAHYQTGRTSVCTLVLVRTKAGIDLPFTTLDAPVETNFAGFGPITYLPTNGIRPSEQVWVGDLSVDTAEATGWIRDSGITEQQIRAGIFNFARWWIFEVNYLDVAAGYVLKGSGTTGETRFSDNAWTVELRSKTQQLKQPMGDLYEITCTVPYGSAPCGKTLEWDGGVVESVDPTEPDRIFYLEADSNLLPPPAYQFGVIRVTSGDNAGAEVEVEVHENDSNGTRIELLLPLPYPLTAADTLDIRIDCNKVARDEVHGCKAAIRWGSDWTAHHRGYPDIPTADGGSSQIPGAQLPRFQGVGGTTQQQ